MDSDINSDNRRQHAREVLTNCLPKSTRPARQRRGGSTITNRKGYNFNKLPNDEDGKIISIEKDFKRPGPDDFVLPGEDEFNKTYNTVRKSSNEAPTSLVAAFSKAKTSADDVKMSSQPSNNTSSLDDVFSEPKANYRNYGNLFGNASSDNSQVTKTHKRQRSRNKDNAAAATITTNPMNTSVSIAPKGSSVKNNTAEDISPPSRSNLSTAHTAINTSSYNKTNGGENNSTDNKTQRDKLDSHDELLVENSNKYRRSAANVKLTVSKGIVHSREKARQVQPKRSLYLPMYIQPVKNDPPTRYPTHRAYGDYGVNRNIISDMYTHNSSTDSLLSKSSISSQRKISTDMNKYDSSSSSDSSSDNETGYKEANEKHYIRTYDYSGIQKPKSVSPPSSDNNTNQDNYAPTRRRRRIRSRRTQNQRRNPGINNRDVSPNKQSSLSGFKPSMHNNNLFIADKYATVPDDFVTHEYKQHSINATASPVKAAPITHAAASESKTNQTKVAQLDQLADKQLIISDSKPNAALDEVHMLHEHPNYKHNTTAEDQKLLFDKKDGNDVTKRRELVGSIRNKFNKTRVVSGDIGQSFLPKTITPENVISNKSTGNYDSVVESKPLLKAKKVSEHFWPRDEATKILLNQNTSQSNSDKMQQTIDQLKGLADDKAIDISEIYTGIEPLDINLPASTAKSNQSKSTNDLTYAEPLSIKRPGILNISKVQMVRIPTLDVSPGQKPTAKSQLDFDKSQSAVDLSNKSETQTKRKRGQSYMKVTNNVANKDELAMTLPNMKTSYDEKLSNLPKSIGLLEMKELTASLRKFKLAGPPTVLKPQKASIFSDPLMHVDNSGTIISADVTDKIGPDFRDQDFDIDEGIVTEAALSPIDHDKNVAKFHAHLESENEVKRKTSNSSARRRRSKGSSNNNSDLSGSSNGSDTQRCKSDPIANRNRKPEVENTALDSNLLGSLQAPKEEEHLSIMSVCTEHISDGSEYEKYEQELNDHLSKYDDDDGSRKGAKKKSLSDPNPKGVISGGFNGDGDVIDEAAVCSASSEPNIAEQCDQLGDLEQFRKYRSSKALSETNIRNENKPSSNEDNKSDSDLMSPRTTRKSVSMKARIRAENGAIKPKELVTSKSHGDLHKQDNMEIFENEENQFNELYESMCSQEQEVEIQPKHVHARSSSEPVPMSEEVLSKVVASVKENKTRGRRVGISHLPFDAANNRDITSSASDIASHRLSDEFKHTDVLSKSMDRGFATLPRAAKSSHYPDPGGKRPDMRLLVLNNLLETEESYVNSLQILYEDYYKPLKKPENLSICEPRLVDEMFYQIPQILQHHESFSDNLRNAAHSWNIEEIKLGELFMNSFNRDMLLESYSAYITNFMNAREAVRLATQSKAGFKAFIEQCQRENKEKQGLNDLMIKPVQRIPRYELILKDLIKHTPLDHPDCESLLIAQQEIHTLAQQMNHGEKEAEMADKHARLLQEIETLVDNCVDLCVPKRRFLRQDIAFEVKNATTRKDRCIWLFNDLIVCTTVKKGRTGTTRRSSMGIWALGEERHSIDFSNKYKFMWKFPLEDIELMSGGIPSKQVVEKQVQDLQNDIEILQQIHKLTNDLSVNHQNLDDYLKNLIQLTNRQLSDKQHLSSMHSTGNTKVEFAISTAGEIKNIEFEFPFEENKHEFETNFTKYKGCLTHQNNLWEPIFMKALPIAKTRSGMQFSCAAPNMASNTRVVWVCNSDGFVGQVCLLDLEKGIPNQTNSIAVCTSKICCIAEIPPPGRKLVPAHEFMKEISKAPLSSPNRRSSSCTSNNNNPAKNIIAWDDDTDEDDEDNTSTVSTSSSANHLDSPHTTNNTTIGLGALAASDSHTTLSEVLGLQEGGAWKKHSDGSTIHGSLDDFLSEEQTHTPFVSGKASSIWLGTEDGRIHIYPSSNTVRGGQDRIRAVHSSSIQCIIHYEGQVFVALSNGDLVCYERNINGDWDFEHKVVLPLGSAQHAISKMVVVDVDGKELWCACQNQIIIVDIASKQIAKSFLVSEESKRQVHCMVSCGFGVWIALDKRPHIKLYHSITNSIITDIDVAAPVNKMLASSDAIIRQHKSACLRITALLVCKELLWVGTSAGVVLTLKLPKVLANTTSLTLPIMPLGLTYGHTGHVRFLTAIEIPEEQNQTKASLKRSSSLSKRRSSAGSNSGSQMLIISGGDGYEDFRMNSSAESAGKEDSTNHLLMWKT